MKFRFATVNDVDIILEFIKELAEYEKYTQTKMFYEEIAKKILGLVYEDEIIFKEKK